MIETLMISITERISLGKTDLRPILLRYDNANVSGQKIICYHSECRKPLVNQYNKELLTKKATLKRPDSPLGSTESTSSDPVRPKRKKTEPKEMVCIFSICDFCKGDASGDLHKVSSTNRGRLLIDIKNKTKDDHVRTCVSDLHDDKDAFAKEKYYHDHCMLYAQRTCNYRVEDQYKVLSAICAEELLVSVQNTLISGIPLNMSQVHESYKEIMRQYHGNIETKDYRKYLKTLISDNLPHVQFVKPKSGKMPDKLVIEETVTEAMEQLSNNSTVGILKNVANMLRKEMMDPNFRNWSFKGRFDDFNYPPIMHFFLNNLLFGSHELKVVGKRNDEVIKTVEMVSQVLIKSMRSSKQMKWKPQKDTTFKDVIQTPLSIGLPLSIHSKVHEKELVQNLAKTYIGSDYRKIINLEKRVEQGVLNRLENSGGFCLPDFVKKNVNTWFAIDNIDLLEDTPTGQNTFHGTLVVINQRGENGDPLNDPLIVPEKLSESPKKFQLEYLQEPVISSIPIKFNQCYFKKHGTNSSNNFTRIWELASCFTTNSRNDDIDIEINTADHDLPETDNDQQQNNKECAGDQSILKKSQIMPTWAATKSLLLSKTSISKLKTNSAVVAPLLKTPPTNYGTLYTGLKMAQGISAEIVGPDRKTLITLDMDLYCRALKLQYSVQNSNWILRPGGLHIAFAALHALGKTIDGSGLDICSIECGTYTSAALRGIYSGKAYKRGMEYYLVLSLAITKLMYEKFDLQSAQELCTAFIDSLQKRSPDMNTKYSDIESFYVNNVKHLESENDGEMAMFLKEILRQIDCLLNFVSACRSGEWIEYLTALDTLVKYFFAKNLINYSRLIPVYLAQMNSLEIEDPTTWEALKGGDFVVAKSEIPFTKLYTDQALEQIIKELKSHGGIIGISQDDKSLDRLITISPHLCHFVKQFLMSFPRDWTTSQSNEHYQLTGDISLRIRTNSIKLSESIEKHCGCNPFKVRTPLKNLASSALIPENVKNDILNYASTGQECYDKFINERLITNSEKSVWDKITKLKLKNFSDVMQKVKANNVEKVIKLREEREVIGRILIIQESRPDLVNLKVTIGDFELSNNPRSLCAVDGSLYIPHDKASLMQVIDTIQEKESESVVVTAPQSQPNPMRIMIVDAMGVLHSIKKTSNMKTIKDLKNAFIKKIENMIGDYNIGHIVFDRYLEHSLKDKTRRKRAKTETSYEVHDEMKFSMTLKELLSSSYTKKLLTAMFAEEILKIYSNQDSLQIYVVYDNKIKGQNKEEHHEHEEADTLIVHQAMVSISPDRLQYITVWSPDTDVLILLLDLAAQKYIQTPNQLRFESRIRKIDVLKCVQIIGSHKCLGLIGLHNFSGADWGGKFVGITKRRWIETYMKLSEGHPVIKCFQELGTLSITTELENGELPANLRPLEEFVCQMYSATGPTSLPILRWELFRSKNMEAENLPPTRAAFLPHITRVNFICMRDKSYNRMIPLLPPIEENGWTIEEGLYMPVKCLFPPAPKAVIELTKCGCKTGCKSLVCACLKNGLPCTPICKCYSYVCENMSRIEVLEDEQEEI